jgi:Asp-tRNA(Asn)/Glu-tRNA(Gln) amidotransferase C subunit
MLRDALKNSPKERSVESIIAEQNAIDKALGLDEPAGKNKLDRIAEIKQQYAATQQTPLQELIDMFGRAGQSKGLTGVAPAFTSMAEQKRAKDLAMAERINELMGGVEDTQRAEKTATKTKVGTAREKDVGDTRLFDREKMQTLGSVFTSEAQRKTQERGQDLTYKAAMASAMQRGDSQEIAKINAASQLAARDETINNWQTQLKELAKIPTQANKVKIADIERQIDQRTKAIYTQFGITIPEAPGAASPGGTTRMRFDAQGNQIK